MTSQNVLQLTQDLISIASASQISNAEVSDYIENFFKANAFDIERLEYTDEAGNRKVSLLARKGEGEGGLGFFSHSDTVPGAEEYWNPYDPVVKDGLLYGRGSCDMKGPLAATMIAAANVDAKQLKHPIYVAATADEEVGFGGARQVCEESQMLRQYGWPTQVVVAEPTELRPVYAHKGGFHIFVTAHGRAAHTSTEKGISANFLIAPFLAEMAELAKLFKTDASFMNHEFDPPSMGFNMVMTDHDCASNVTAARTDVKLSLRAMPNDRHEDAVAMIVERAKKYDLEVSSRGVQAFYTSPDAELIQVALSATGVAKAETVPFGTEALLYQNHVNEQVILGPGNIAQAHTVGEYIDLAQLENSVDVYARMIEELCIRK
ncbi:MAG: M20/M25/M40 family metallo-hydrolase [Caldilineaceae bacterium]